MQTSALTPSPSFSHYSGSSVNEQCLPFMCVSSLTLSLSLFVCLVYSCIATCARVPLDPTWSFVYMISYAYGVAFC